MPNVDYSKDYESTYNVALGTTFRIQQALLDMNLFFGRANYAMYYHSMNTLFHEVAPFLNDKELPKIVELKRKLQVALDECYNKQSGISQCSNQLVFELEEYDIILRKLMMKYSLYTKLEKKTMAAQRTV